MTIGTDRRGFSHATRQIRLGIPRRGTSERRYFRIAMAATVDHVQQKGYHRDLDKTGDFVRHAHVDRADAGHPGSESAVCELVPV